MKDSPVIFTAAEIGRCIDCLPQSVRKSLRDIPPGGKKIVSYVETAAWQFDSLPSSLVEKLAQAAKRHGFPTPLLLLQNAPRREEPAPSLTHLADAEIARAQKLQRALAPCLRSATELPIAQLARAAAGDYRREFGHVVSDRHLRGLISRTIERDRGHGNFAKLALYLAGRPEKRFVRPSPLARSFRFDELDAHFATLRDRTAPTCAEIAHSWREVVRLLVDRLTTGADETKLKRELRDYLRQVAPFMGDSDSAIKRALNRKFRDAIERGGIDRLTDGRLDPKLRRKKILDFPKEIKKQQDYSAKFCAGRDSQAYRELVLGTSANGERFSEEFLAVLPPFDVRRAKSRMPDQLRRAARPGTKRLLDKLRGSREIEKHRPFALLDWSKVASGDYYSADDVTGNHYVYEFRTDGEWECERGRFNVGRPQFLITIDERSTFPLGVSVRLARRYERMMILASASRVCRNEATGLPHVGWVLESGPWASGDVTQSLVGWAESDEAFRREGISQKIIRARTSRGKARIENAIGRIQSFFDFGEGYCGRDEKSVRYQRVTAFVNSLKRISQPKKEAIDPGLRLMSVAEYEAALNAAVLRYRAEPQNGEWLRDESQRGLSPEEAWTHFASPRPHQVLPDSLSYLWAPATSRQTVSPNGVMVRIGGWKHYYRGSDQLGLLLGERVVVRYYPEFPSHVYVTSKRDDPNGRSPFAVPLVEQLPARSATSEQFEQDRAQAALFVNAPRTFYREYAPPTNLTVRNTALGSTDLRASGEAHARLLRETVALDDQREKSRTEIDRLARRQNLAIDPAKVRRPQRVAQNLRELEDLKAQLRALEAAESGQGEDSL